MVRDVYVHRKHNIGIQQPMNAIRLINTVNFVIHRQVIVVMQVFNYIVYKMVKVLNVHLVCLSMRHHAIVQMERIGMVVRVYRRNPMIHLVFGRVNVITMLVYNV